jgi:hypothetical protein
MRLLIGMVLGAALTVGVAYTHDRHPEMIAAGIKPMVNWDVVDTNVAAIKSTIAEAWHKAAG